MATWFCAEVDIELRAGSEFHPPLRFGQEFAGGFERILFGAEVFIGAHQRVVAVQTLNRRCAPPESEIQVRNADVDLRDLRYLSC